MSVAFSDGSSYQPMLAEAEYEVDETTTYPNSAPTFHGYSWSGEASGEFVYVGRGQQVDFDRLTELGVELEGKIALARYGGPFRGLKVKNAQDHGMVGCIIYTDIRDDGNITEANGYEPYPFGYARNPTSVQRGSVQFLSIYPGDPTTPGYPSKEDSPRTGTERSTPRIPSIPISWQDALPLLEALDGNGPSGEEINRTNWIGAADVGYNSGPVPGATISMSNQMNDTITPIWNTIGIINGTHNPDEVVVIGNHRDAWMIGGAADPNSGSAVMIELARAFGALLETGWKPRRTIVLASWDGEEYGLVGSTEWFEEYVPWISATNVAYINLDTAVSGSNPGISATPDFHKIAIETMKKVVFPYHGLTNVTMYDVWYELSGGQVGVLGSGSDYTGWVHHTGVSSIDMGSDAGPEDPVYHYHSNYDTYHWMSTYAGKVYH
jgi:N-acetylated-alpha-linked acidic dipeptidase